MDDEERLKWLCPHCHFLNDDSLFNCEKCSYKRKINNIEIKRTVYEDPESIIKYRIRQPSFSEIQKSVKYGTRSAMISTIVGITIAGIMILIIHLLLHSQNN